MSKTYTGAQIRGTTNKKADPSDRPLRIYLINEQNLERSDRLAVQSFDSFLNQSRPVVRVRVQQLSFHTT